MTDAEIRALVEKLDPDTKTENDLGWWKACVDVTRQILEAPDGEAAKAIAEDNDWGDMEFVKDLRAAAGVLKERICPFCGGKGKIKD